MDITGLGSVADLATTVVNKLFPDKSEQEKMQLAQVASIVQGQIDINKAEALNPSIFVSGWRPSVGWVCSIALAYQFILRPILSVSGAIFHFNIPVVPGIDDNLWQLLTGMLGLGGMRSWEKSKGVAK